jgi:hypothetical protein
MLAASKVPASDFIKVRIVADEARIESELAWLDLREQRKRGKQHRRQFLHTEILRE